MASPLKFLARLVSPRRPQRQKNGSADDVTPELLAIVTPPETSSDKTLASTDQPAGAAAVVQHSHPVTNAQVTANIEDTTFVEAADPTRSGGLKALVAPKPSLSGDDAIRKRSRRSKGSKSLETVPPSSPSIPAASIDALRLDEEIGALRDALARKLQLQNAQLKRMLERF